VHLAAGAVDAYAAWRVNGDGQVRDVVAAKIGDPPMRIRDDGWSAPGCPHTGPAIGLGSDGILHAAWYTGAPGQAGVHYRRWRVAEPDSTGPAAAVVVGERMPTTHVALALTSVQQAVIACDATSGGARTVTLARTDAADGRVAWRREVPGSEGATYPQLAIRDNRGIVAWSVTSEDRSAIRLARWPIR
jgi:hypothetical protein